MCIQQSIHRIVIGCVVASAAIVYAATQQGLGYKGTPQIPGTTWCVHDGDRPQPRVVEPGSTFSQGASPPADATVLFDGKDQLHWTDTRGRPAAWRVNSDELYMECGRGAGNIRSKDKFADFQLHLEFATPSPPRGTGQGRGNSGVLINGMYEVQVLDSYQDKTYPDGQCGALYGQTPPLVNASKAPGQWQSYDIIFESPRWDENGTVTKRANVTVIQNGVVLHHRREFIGATDGIGGVAHTALGAYLRPHAPEVSIELQDHGNPIRYRNIWIRALGNYDQS
jgi:hypothetical protein